MRMTPASDQPHPLRGIGLLAAACSLLAVPSPACAKGPGEAPAPAARAASPGPGGAATAPTRTSDGRAVLFSKASRFNGHVYVFQEGAERVLRFAPRGARQSVARPGHPERLELLYTQGAVAALAAAPDPRRVLVVGLGGGSLPRFILHYFPRATVDAVDIDPVVVEAARAWFELPKPPDPAASRLHVHVGDGRAFLEGAGETRWDVIILDAYGNASPPPSLTTLEFLRTVRGHLAPGGVAVANVWVRRYNPLYDRMIATYAAVFGDVQGVEVPAGSDLVLVCGPPSATRACAVGRRALTVASVRLAQRLRLSFDLAALVRAGYHTARRAPGATPLLDAKRQGAASTP